MEWLTYINPNDGKIEWGGYDPSNNENPLRNGDDVVTIQFLALQPQTSWLESPLHTTKKFAGNTAWKDLTITPTNGIIQVLKVSSNVIMLEDSVPGQVSQACDVTLGEWKAGDWISWDNGDPHAVYNFSMQNRYAIQLTGTPKIKQDEIYIYYSYSNNASFL